MIVTIEYVFNNPKLDELAVIIKNTQLEHDKQNTEIITGEKSRLDVILNFLIK